MTARLTSPKQVRHALAYVLCNARKHGVAPPTRGGPGPSWVDSCSSARSFEGWSREVCSSDVIAIAATAPPRTWLLRIGWRRGGSLHPDHCPGQAVQ
jgi:putative transposase